MTFNDWSAKGITKLFISGPVTGRPNNNAEMFKAKAKALHKRGFEVVNSLDVKSDKSNSEGLRSKIDLMKDCHAIALLPGWELSRGAQFDSRLAEALGAGPAPPPTSSAQ